MDTPARHISCEPSSVVLASIFLVLEQIRNIRMYVSSACTTNDAGVTAGNQPIAPSAFLELSYWLLGVVTTQRIDAPGYFTSCGAPICTRA